MNATYTVGRIFLSLVFIVAGIQKVMNVGGIAKMLEDNKVPIPEQIVPYLGAMPKYEALGYLVAGIEVVGGLMVLVGLWARWGALLLALFTAGTIYFVHHFWEHGRRGLHQQHDAGAEEPVDHRRAAAGRGRGFHAGRRHGSPRIKG